MKKILPSDRIALLGCLDNKITGCHHRLSPPPCTGLIQTVIALSPSTLLPCRPAEPQPVKASVLDATCMALHIQAPPTQALAYSNSHGMRGTSHRPLMTTAHAAPHITGVLSSAPNGFLRDYRGCSD